MKEPELDGVDQYLESQTLNLAMGIVNRTARKFNITQEEARAKYKITRQRIKRNALLRGIVYLMVGLPTLAAGLLGTFGDTGLILYGATLFGAAFIATSFGLFRLAI